MIAQEKNGRPFSVAALRPIQLSKRDVLDALYAGRSEVHAPRSGSTSCSAASAWSRPRMTERNRDVMLLRMVPFVENNYNLVELGPRGTGKSHLFQQISPYSHLVSRRQGDGRPDVREQRHRPAGAGLPVRRRLLR